MDNLTLTRIKLLHPLVRDEALEIYHSCNKALTGEYTLRFTHTLRTFEEQARLYEQGRKRRGQIVTWAKAGQSYHNYGLAIDICLITRDYQEVSWDNTADFDMDGVADWVECARIFESKGWEWGGRWKRPKTDIPHFQKTFGKSTRQLFAIKEKTNKAYPALV